MLSCFRCVQIFATPWTVVHQAPLSMGLSRQEYWSGFPCPPPGDLSHSGIEPEILMSPALQAGSLPLAPPGKPLFNKTTLINLNQYNLVLHNTNYFLDSIAGRGTPSRAQNWALRRLTLVNVLSEETHMLTKQEISLGRGAQVESSRVREPRRTALPCGLQSWVLW